MGTRRHYEDDFKKQVVRLVLESQGSIPQIARDLDISAGNLRRWVRAFRDEGNDMSGLSQDDAFSGVKLSAPEYELSLALDFSNPPV